MDIVVPAGRAQDCVALKTLLDTLRLHLYANNVIPDIGSVVGDFTEASFPGYASVLTNAWGTPFVNSLNQGQVDEVIRNFVLSAGGGPYPIYGYYLTLPSGALYGAVRDPAAPVMLSTAGQSYVVQCQRTVGSIVVP